MTTPPDPAPSERSRLETRRIALGLFALALVVHLGLGAAGVWSFSSLNYDDPQVLALAEAKPVKDLLTEPTWYAYKPVYFLSLKVDTLFGPAVAGVAHVHNLLLHALAVVLLFFVLSGLLGRRWVAAWAAAFFAVHPVHVESIAWIAGRKDVLSLVLVLAGHLLYRRARTRGRYPWATPILLALAGLAKGTVWVYPGVLLLDEVVEGWRARREGAAFSARRAFFRLLPNLVVGLLGVGLDAEMAIRHGPGAVEHGVATVSLAAAAAGVYARYVGNLLLPTRLALDYGVSPAGRWLSVPSLLGLLLFAGAVALLVVSLRRRWTPGLVGAGVWLLGLLPVNDLWPRTAILMADRYLYLPAIGFFIVLAALVARLPRRAIVAAAVLVVFAGLGARRTDAFRDSETVWSDAVEKAPASALAWIQASEAAASRGAWTLAEERAAKAVALDPRPELLVKARLFEAQAALGRVAQEVSMGRTPAAGSARALREKTKRALDLALALGGMPLVKQDPREVQAEAWVLRGQALEVSLDPVGALDAYQKAVDTWPRNAAAHHDLATLLARTGAEDALRVAEDHLRDALAVQPDFLDARLQLANVLALEGRPDDALAELDRAEQRHGRTADVLFARAQVHLAGRKDVNAAKTLLAELDRWWPEDPRGRQLLSDIHLAEGRLLLERGRDRRDRDVLESALARFEQAAKEQPRREDPVLGAGDALLELGRFEEARRRYREAAERAGGKRWILRLAARAGVLQAAWLERTALDDIDRAHAARLVATSLDPQVTRLDLGILPLTTELPYLRDAANALEGPAATGAGGVLRASALAVTGDEKGARTLLDGVLAQPDRGGGEAVRSAALLLRGLLRTLEPDADAARRDYTLLAEARPDDPLPRLRLLSLELSAAGARWTIARGDPSNPSRIEETGRAYDEVAGRLRALADAHPDFLEAGLLAAETEMSQQRWVEALKRLNALQQRHPEDPSVLRGQAAVYVQQFLATRVQEVFQEAVRTLDKALLLDPRDPRTYLDASHLFRVGGNLGRAIAYAEKARRLELAPRGVAARMLADLHLAIGRQALDGGSPGKALAAAGKAAEADASRAAPWVLRGDVYLSQRLYDKAFDAFRTAKELEPMSKEAAQGLARIHAARARVFRIHRVSVQVPDPPPQTRQDWDQLDPAEQKGALAAWEKTKEEREAQREGLRRQEAFELEAALRLDPRAEKADDWRDILDRLREQDPEAHARAVRQAQGLLTDAKALREKQQFGDALQKLREALSLYPDYAVAHYLLAATAYDLLRQGEGTTKESKQLEARWINEAFASLQALDTMAAPGVFPERHLYRGLLNEVLFRRSGAEAARLAAVGAFRTFLAAAEANGMADDDPLVRTARERLKALDH